MLTTADVRHFLTTLYSDDELTSLCFDRFPTVHDAFSTGMSKGQKIQLLLEYSERHTEWSVLLSVLESDRPQQYAAFLETATAAEVTRRNTLGPAFEAQLKAYVRHVSEDTHQVMLHLNVPGNFSTTLQEIAVTPNLSRPLKFVERSGSPAPWDYHELYGTGVELPYPHLLIIGEGGSGKSFLGQILCHTLANQFLEKETGRIPIKVPLLDLEIYLRKQPTASDLATIRPLIQFLADHEYQRRGAHQDKFPVEFWENVLQDQPTWMIFDGLDEVLSADIRACIIEFIRKLRAAYPNLATLILFRSSALVSELSGLEYQVSKLQPLTSDQQIDVLQRLDRAFVTTFGTLSQSQHRLDEFRVLLALDSLKNWLNKPLFLTAGYLYYNLKETTLKSQEFFVQKGVIQLALRDWDAIKFRTAKARYGDLPVSPSSEEELDNIDLMTLIGWQLYRQTKRETTIETIAEWVLESDQRFTRRQVTSKIMGIAERSQILEVSSRKATFRNEADMLFFAGYYSAQNSKTWPEVITHFSDPAFPRLIFAIHDLLAIEGSGLADDFLSCLWQQADQQSDRQIHAELIRLIAECLLRSGVNIPTPLKEVIVDRIITIIEKDKQQATKLRTRIELAQALGYLGDKRLEKDDMVFVPRGEFYMGYDFFPADRPARRVLVEDFYIDKYPVTNMQFQAFLEAGGYQNPQYWTPAGWEWVQSEQRKHPKYWNDPRFNFPNYPVVGVSWYEAAAYAKWVGKRLPSEQEWEKAARGTKYDPITKRLSGPGWAWGNEFRSDYLNCAEGEDPVGAPTPVGIYPAGSSPYGVYDMCGNVSEWTGDWYGPYPNSTFRDSHFGESFKVRRGGGWAADQDFVRCTCRIESSPTSDFAVIGFRCCKDRI
jgi:formylglycine-generating enzyme required for sulfatase activity